MKRVSIYIAIFLFVAWVAALLLNIDIYRKANIELSIFGPIIDAILIVLIALLVYVGVASSKGKNDRPNDWVNKSLLLLGVGTVFMISFFYVTTFR